MRTVGGNDVFVREPRGRHPLRGERPGGARQDRDSPTSRGTAAIVVFETGQTYDAGQRRLSTGNDVYRRDMGTGAIALVSASNGDRRAAATPTA